MVRLRVCFVLLIAVNFHSIGQPVASSAGKRVINVSDIEKWPELGMSNLSRDGNYVLYKIHNQPAGSSTLVAQSADKQWKRELVGVAGGTITEDCRWVVFQKGDSIGLLLLGGQEAVYIVHAGGYQLFMRNKACWLIYSTTAGAKSLVLRELSTAKEKRFSGLMEFRFDKDMRTILWQSSRGEGSDKVYSLYCLDVESLRRVMIREDAKIEATDLMFNEPGTVLLFKTMEVKLDSPTYRLHWYERGSGQDRVIWEDKYPSGNCSLDMEGNQLVFLAGGAIWYYKKGLDKMVQQVTNNTPGMDSLVIYTSTPPSFSKDGSRILFLLIEKELPKAAPDAVQLDVWHYRDKVLQAEQLTDFRLGGKAFAAIMNLTQHRVIRIEREGEEAIRLDGAGKFVIVTRGGASSEDWYWQQGSGIGVSLVSLEDGARKLLPIDNRYNGPIIAISPHEDYIVYYDPAGDNYWSYQIDGGVTRNMTKGLGVSWRQEPYYNFFNVPNPFFGKGPSPRGIAGWVDGDSHMLIYDSYDIWTLDPSGQQHPVNITHGYGRRHHIVFDPGRYLRADPDSLMLMAFNQDTKYMGYYRQKLPAKGDPEQLMMGPYFLRDVSKSRGANQWLITRSSPSEAPNVYVTRDFKQFIRLSDMDPEKEYNWYTSELVRWKLPGGDSCQGILYKPEGIKAAKKYPILFNYYQRASDGLYGYCRPATVGSSNINVPYFTSRGYLVFMPDIHYRMGHPGQSALNAIESAAKYLLQRSYVDSKRMALAGHSWGGYETNYIITHSHLFAAAAEGAGVSDFISDYGGLSGVNGIGFSRQPLYEISQSRIGVTLWQAPGLYRENSPVLQADQVTCPLLMLHNKLDDAVPWTQGVELFTALRRLGKRAWMLQYDGEGHSLRSVKNILDYTLRLTQFFDHYLKGASPPKWMVSGIPATRKGIDTGLMLEMSGQEP